jgi:hypothetical protein
VDSIWTLIISNTSHLGGHTDVVSAKLVSSLLVAVGLGIAQTKVAVTRGSCTFTEVFRVFVENTFANTVRHGGSSVVSHIAFRLALVILIIVDFGGTDGGKYSESEVGNEHDDGGRVLKVNYCGKMINVYSGRYTRWDPNEHTLGSQHGSDRYKSEKTNNYFRMHSKYFTQ